MELHPILNARQRTHNLTALDDMLSLEAGGKRLDGTSSSQSSNVNFPYFNLLVNTMNHDTSACLQSEGVCIDVASANDYLTVASTGRASGRHIHRLTT
jgi:hypothetical protein